MRISIILNEPYPYGMACTNRIHAYAKSFKELGHSVIIIVPKTKNSPEKNPVDPTKINTFEGIEYCYATKSNERSKSYIKRGISDILGPLKCYRILKRYKQKDIILLVSNVWYHILLFRLYAIIFNSAYIQEKSELPPPVRKKSRFLIKKLIGNLYIKFAYKPFDGLIVISHYLHDYFRNKVSKRAKLIVIPIIVDIKRFYSSEKKTNQNKIKKFVYAGSLCQEKDGILDLIKAFKILSDKRNDVQLILIGNIDKSKNKEELMKLINHYNLKEKINITGFISREELTDYYREATALVLCKPKTLQNEYCFPTKIGEYLSTGNPVVTTNIGEVTHYLKDNENAFIAETGNIESFAFKLNEVLENKSSKRIGEQGKKTAEEEFNYIKAGERLITFFHQLIKSKNDK